MNISDPAKISRIFQSMESEDENRTASIIKAQEEKQEVEAREVQKLIDEVQGFEKEIGKKTLYRLWREVRKQSTYGANCFKIDSKIASVQEVALMILDDDYYSLPLMCALVSWALENNIGLIVESTHKKLLQFRDLLLKAGWPPELFSVVPHVKNSHEIKRLSIIIYVGNRIEATSLYKIHWNRKFSFICLNHTASLLLESCDLHSAVDKIIKCTWGADSDALWGVSMIVVQESIYDKFIKVCEFQLEKLTPDNTIFRMNATEPHVDKLVDKAKLSGARILETNNCSKNLWRPRFLLNYHGQNLETLGRVIKVTTCRTAKEGITLLNSDPTIVSVSVWTDICSQALEVASMSVSTHLCINSHGIMSAEDPIYFSNFVLNGQTEYTSLDKILLDLAEPCSNERNASLNAVRATAAMVAATEKAFQSWKVNEDKLLHIINIVEELKTVENEISSTVQMELWHNWEYFRGDSSTCYAIHERVPIGVVVIYTEDIFENFFQALVQILLNGNGIILIGLNFKKFERVFDVFTKHLPRNLLQLVEKNEEITQSLVSNPNIKEFWALGGYDFLKEVFLDLKMCETSTDKSHKFFLVPDKEFYTFLNKPYKLKVIYLPKVDRFPL